MKYSELIRFKPIESTIQLLETADKKIARDMVQTYVMSDTMAENLKATVIDQLQMEEVIDNKAVMIVGNYGTGKSHLMSVVSAIATDEENIDYVQNKKYESNCPGRHRERFWLSCQNPRQQCAKTPSLGVLCASTCCHAAVFMVICAAGKRHGNKFSEDMKIIAGKFEVLRLKVDGLTMPLREVILAEIEDDLCLYLPMPEQDADFLLGAVNATLKEIKWYIPDVHKEADVAKLHEKKLWKEKNYQAIVNLAERLPEQTVQEDPNILMYYDISLSRV